MLGLGELPAAAVIYFRRTMPESPRFLARVGGDARAAARSMERYTSGALRVEEVHEPVVRLAFWQFIANPRYLLMLLGTAGTWFVFDYAYYGNSISTPLILKDVAPGASPITAVAWTLIIFAVAAVPGYVMSFLKMDRIGHKRLQIIGFTVMGLAFLAIGVVPGLAHVVAPFLIVYGISYFFAEFGPNCTTFVLSAELYPVSARTTGHGMSAGIAKFGAFIGVFLFPILNNTLGLSGTLTLTCALSLVGALLTLVLP
jgi:MFS family permease